MKKEYDFSNAEQGRFYRPLLKKELHHQESLRILRDAKIEEGNADTISFEDAKKQLGVE